MIRFSERVDQRTLTVNERTLLHLYERSVNKDLADAPFALTQQGIARALRIRVNHVSRAVKTLEEQKCLTETTARVRGEVRKRKVYLISHEGHAAAQSISAELGRSLVSVRDDRGALRELSMADARKLPGGPFTFTDILSNLDSDGLLEVARLTPGREGAALSHHDEGRPRGEAFFGRSRELNVIREWAGSSVPVLVVTGPRGIGKSSLVSKALGDLEAERHSFWYTVRKGDRLEPMVRPLAAFLTSIGRGDLGARLLERAASLADVETTLQRDWPAPNGVLVLDDADLAPGEVVRAFVDGIRKRGGKLVLTAENPIADQAHLRASGAAEVLPLAGMERPECRRLAPKGMSSEEFEKIYRLSRGNPLSVIVLSADALEGLDARFSPEERALLRALKLRQDSD